MHTASSGVPLSEIPWDRQRWPLQNGDLNLDDGEASFLEKCFDETGEPIEAEIKAQVAEWAASEETQRELAIFGGDVLNGRSFLEANLRSMRNPGDMTYTKCPEALRSRAPDSDIPRGKVWLFDKYVRPDSDFYPGVTHDIWIYAPANLSAKMKAGIGLVVCCDGEGYLDEGPRSSVAACAVLDTLIHSGEIPSVAGLFIQSGQHPQKSFGGQRKIEYDLCNDEYARFVKEDLVPLVEQTIGCELSRDPAKRVICGHSSGGHCAFNAAWHRPETFGSVISACGTFVNMNPIVELYLDDDEKRKLSSEALFRGGECTAYKVRMTRRKPIKVFLTTGENDSNHALGNWPLATKLVADALDYAGYKVRFELGVGSHSLQHIGSLFADALRWCLNP